MNSGTNSMNKKWFYWKLHKKVAYYHWRDHQKLKLRMLKVGWEERAEHDNEFSPRPYIKPRQFLWLLFKSIMLNRICPQCDGAGMTGYEEPEACSHCDGYCFNWTENLADWQHFVMEYEAQ